MNIRYKFMSLSQVLWILIFLLLSNHSFASAVDNKVPNDEIQNKNLDNLTTAIIKMLDSGQLDKDPESKQKAIAVKKSYAEQKKAEAALAKSTKELEIRKEIQRLTEAQNGIDQDMSQALQERCVKELKLDSFTIFKMMEKRDPLVLKIWDKMVAEDMQKLRKQAELNIAAKRKTKKQ